MLQTQQSVEIPEPGITEMICKEAMTTALLPLNPPCSRGLLTERSFAKKTSFPGIFCRVVNAALLDRGVAFAFSLPAPKSGLNVTSGTAQRVMKARSELSSRVEKKTDKKGLE